MDLRLISFHLILVMGLLDKTLNKKNTPDIEFTPDESKFILAKLRTADYKGSEFEMFYNVYTKIQSNLDN